MVGGDVVGGGGIPDGEVQEVGDAARDLVREGRRQPDGEGGEAGGLEGPLQRRQAAVEGGRVGRGDDDVGPGGGQLDEGEGGEQGADEGGDEGESADEAAGDADGDAVGRGAPDAAEAAAPAADGVEQAVEGAERGRGGVGGDVGVAAGERGGFAVVGVVVEGYALVGGRVGVLDYGEDGEDGAEGVRYLVGHVNTRARVYG